MQFSLSDAEDIIQDGIITNIEELLSNEESQCLNGIRSVKPDEAQIQMKYSANLYKDQKIALSYPQAFMGRESEELFELYLKL